LTNFKYILVLALLVSAFTYADDTAIAEDKEKYCDFNLYLPAKSEGAPDTFTANVAVESDAIQNLNGETVVFIREGNRFEASEIKTGRKSGDYVEVLSGLEPGAEYVIGNSYLIKADILKQGAGHSH